MLPTANPNAPSFPGLHRSRSRSPECGRSRTLGFQDLSSSIALDGGDRRPGWWTEAEDDQLRQLVAEHGTTSWAFISQYIPNRNGKSCRLRWTNQIAPDVVHAPFTFEEDAKIVEEYRKRGNRWAAIARLLRGRTENSVKNCWHSCLKHSGGGFVEGLAGKMRYQDEGCGDEVGWTFKKPNLGSYTSAAVSLCSVIGRSRSEVLSPSSSRSNRANSAALCPSGSDTGLSTSTGVKGNNFDVGADDPLTTLKLW